MRTLRRRLVAILGAAGIGALAAILRRRAQGGAATVDEPPEPAGAAASAPIPPDAQAAIDEARERLRARAEALRQEIDGDADPAG